jgi:pyruvate/2-oxoglutarate/acetoin dehydrogenase E1 component
VSALEFPDAIRDALAEELERDPCVVFFGEDIAAPGGVFKVTSELFERFGPERVFDTPISELALAGAAYGAAVTGLRPVIEVMFGDFMGLAMASLVNQAAKFWYISGEQQSVPLVVRSAVGGGGRFGAIHSQTHGTWFLGVPGLKIVFPSSPSEAKGLLKASIRDDNPVIFLEHKQLYSINGPPPDREIIPLGEAAVARPGDDLTLVSVGKGVDDALAAAHELAADGISAEVIDLRTLRPLDVTTVLRSVARTNRLLAIEEGPARAGGRPGCWAWSQRRDCTTSTTPGSSRPMRRRSPTAPRSRTRSSPIPPGSWRACGHGPASASPDADDHLTGGGAPSVLASSAGSHSQTPHA